MAKKIRFSLEMKNGVEVTDLEGLQENFDLEKVKEYMVNGRLLTWLQDRYYEDEADEIEELDNNDVNLGEKLCKIFQVPYDPNEDQSLEKIEKVNKLKQYTDNEEILNNAMHVAFSQEELADLLDEDTEKIYLCGDKFNIPLSKTNTTYIGVNNPVVAYRNKKSKDLNELGIKFVSVQFEEGVTPQPGVQVQPNNNQPAPTVEVSDDYEDDSLEDDLYIENALCKGEEYASLFMLDSNTGDDIRISEEFEANVLDYCQNDKYIFYSYDNYDENEKGIMRYDKSTKETIEIPNPMKTIHSSFPVKENVGWYCDGVSLFDETGNGFYTVKRDLFTDANDSKRTNGMGTEELMKKERTMFCNNKFVYIVTEPHYDRTGFDYENRVYRMDLDGNNIRGVDELVGCTIGWLYDDYIYYVAKCKRWKIGMFSGSKTKPCDIKKYNVKTRKTSKVADECSGVYTDGKKVYFIAEGTLYSQNMDGTKKVELNTLTEETRFVIEDGEVYFMDEDGEKKPADLQ